MPRRITWWLLTRCVALVFRFIPKRHRFRVVASLCNVLTPILGERLRRRAGRKALCSGPFDEVMRLAMRILADGGVTFDAPLVIDSPVALERRVIYVGGHYPIANFFLRHALDHGIEPAVVKAFPEIDRFIWGTRTEFEAIEPSPTALLKLQRRIEAGHPGLVLIDNSRSASVAFHSEYGDGHVSTRVFDFATRFAIPMFFLCVRSDDQGRPVIVIRPMAADPNEFIAHLLEQAARLRH
jgi:hypothetical protein